MRVKELAEALHASYEGNGETELSGAAPLETAGPGQLSFVSGRKHTAHGSNAGCLIVPNDYPNDASQTFIRAAAPRAAFARAVARLHPPREIPPGIHPTAVIDPEAGISATAAIGPHAVIRAGACIGDRTTVGAGCAVGARVTIGENCTIHENVTIHDDVEIGRGVILHSGCVIGADGFGFELESGRYVKFPQIGRVAIGDFVEIGANACIDRASLGVTRIGEGTKLDNMVHVAHNCEIGRHVVIAAQTGISGGVVVEDYAVLGGQVGLGDKARIGTRAVLGGKAGVLSNKVVRANEVVWGIPARPLRQHLQQLAHLARLPELLRGIRGELSELKRRLARLEERA